MGWERFLQYIYNEHHYKPKPNSRAISSVKKLGKANGDNVPVNIHSAFEYLGGFDENNIAQFDEENYFKLFYWQSTPTPIQ